MCFVFSGIMEMEDDRVVDNMLLSIFGMLLRDQEFNITSSLLESCRVVNIKFPGWISFKIYLRAQQRNSEM